MEKFDVIIIGAGASGLMAAGQAATRGLDVLVLEKMRMPARKLRITGKGRCNITNTATLKEFLTHVGPDSRFLYNAFSKFFNNELIEFFESIGLETITERGNRVFPLCEDAKEVVDKLVRWTKNSGAYIKCESAVDKILVENGEITGVILKDEKTYYCKSLIIATGGASYPLTGSTGDGYKMAKSIGHKVIQSRPALVPLVTSGNIAPKLQGLSLKNINAVVWVDGKKTDEEFGEMLFTHYGLTGPIILSLSRKVVDYVDQKKKVIISIDLKPALDDKKLDARLLRDFDENGKKLFHNIARLWLPSSMVPVCSELLKIPLDKPVNQLSSEERKRIRLWLKDFRFEVTGYRGFDEAIITAGGVETKEINPKTMESKLIKNLYFAGEIIDLDADTGGYNLQIAFSTGWMAGNSVLT